MTVTARSAWVLSPFWDLALFIASPLLVAAHRVAATVIQGVHGRRRVGQGETFWEYRRFAYGDSPHAGAGAMAWADGDEDLARGAAEDLAGMLQGRRDRFAVHLPSAGSGLAQALGALPAETFIVGCEPAQVDELTTEMTPAVRAAVHTALVHVDRLLLAAPAAPPSAASAPGGATGSDPGDVDPVERMRQRDEILQIMFWIQAEGLGPDVAAADGSIEIIGAPDGRLQPPDHVLDARNSGTTIRLLAGILAQTRTIGPTLLVLAGLGIGAVAWGVGVVVPLRVAGRWPVVFTVAILVALVAAGDLEAQLAPGHLDQLDGGGRFHAHGRGSGVAEVDVGAEAVLTLQQGVGEGPHAGPFHERHQVGGGEDRRHGGEIGEVVRHLRHDQPVGDHNGLRVGQAGAERWLGHAAILMGASIIKPRS